MLKYLSLFSLVLMAAVVGCGPSRGKTFPAKGTLSVDGAAFGNVVVVLGPKEKSTPGATGKVKADGSFTLTTYEDGDGVGIGEFEVTLLEDPMAEKPGPAPLTKPFTVSIKAPSGSDAISVEIKLESVKGTPGQTSSEPPKAKGPGGI